MTRVFHIFAPRYFRWNWYSRYLKVVWLLYGFDLNFILTEWKVFVFFYLILGIFRFRLYAVSFFAFKKSIGILGVFLSYWFVAVAAVWESIGVESYFKFNNNWKNSLETCFWLRFFGPTNCKLKGDCSVRVRNKSNPVINLINALVTGFKQWTSDVGSDSSSNYLNSHYPRYCIPLDLYKRSIEVNEDRDYFNLFWCVC